MWRGDAGVGKLEQELIDARLGLLHAGRSGLRLRSMLSAVGRVQVHRPGSHTLRHTLVQRLVDADFALKEIGYLVGHRSPRSPQIYSKVAVESLRKVVLGDGEEFLNE